MHNYYGILYFIADDKDEEGYGDIYGGYQIYFINHKYELTLDNYTYFKRGGKDIQNQHIVYDNYSNISALL